MSDLQTEIQHALNSHSAENGSDTPDYILAEFLTGCLEAYNRAVRRREAWHEGGVLKPFTYIPQWVETPTTAVETVPQPTTIC